MREWRTPTGRGEAEVEWEEGEGEEERRRRRRTPRRNNGSQDSDRRGERAVMEEAKAEQKGQARTVEKEGSPASVSSSDGGCDD